MPNWTASNPTRRQLIVAGAASALALALPRGAFALTEAEASRLIQTVVDEINSVINSGRSEAAMYQDFERIFSRYADVPTIARFTLGPDARAMSSGQINAFAEAFKGYISRKYGKRFREFIGGSVEVQDARPIQNAYEVRTVAYLRGEDPFEVSFMVSDRSGRDLFFDMRIEGISLLKAEATEIRAMLDQRGGNVAQLTNDLQSMG